MTRYQFANRLGVTDRPVLRADLQIVADMIEPGSRLLDLGCAEGDLLQYLRIEKDVDGRGMELSQAGVNACVARGLSVIQGDADLDLVEYPDDAFDYVVLSQSLQVLRYPDRVVREMLRIGERAIVSFPNFGYWRMRLQLLVRGRMPVTKTLPRFWYDTPNIHFCTILDFLDLCRALGVTVERAVALSHDGRIQSVKARGWQANLLGEQGIFLLRRH